MALSAYSAEHLSGIGRVVIGFQNLEAVLVYCVSAVIDREDQDLGAIICAQMSFDRLCHTLAALAKHRVRDPRAVTMLDELLVRISTAEQDRNRLLHSAWGIDDETGVVRRFKTTARRKEGLRQINEAVVPEALHEAADRLAQLYHDLLIWAEDFIPRPAP
jgi:hypothetical protein